MQIEFAKHERLISKLARQFHRRAIASGANSLILTDVYQEMCVAWCLARDGYSELSGVPFTAYLVRGIRNHVNRWVGKEIWHGKDKIELDRPAADAEEDMHNVIANEALSPEDEVIAADLRAVQREIMSETAQKYLEALESPPPALYQILDAMQAKRSYAESRGVTPGFYFRQLKAPLIFDLMGLDTNARLKLKKELALYAALEEMAND